MSFNEFSADLQYQDDVNVFRSLQRPRNVECYAARAGGLAGGLTWERGSLWARVHLAAVWDLREPSMGKERGA